MGVVGWGDEGLQGPGGAGYGCAGGSPEGAGRERDCTMLWHGGGGGGGAGTELTVT